LKSLFKSKFGDDESVVLLFRPRLLQPDMVDCILNLYMINGVKVIDKCEALLDERQIRKLAKLESVNVEQDLLKYKYLMEQGSVEVCVLQRNAAFTYSSILSRENSFFLKEYFFNASYDPQQLFLETKFREQNIVEILKTEPNNGKFVSRSLRADQVQQPLHRSARARGPQDHHLRQLLARQAEEAGQGWAQLRFRRPGR